MSEHTAAEWEAAARKIARRCGAACMYCPLSPVTCGTVLEEWCDGPGRCAETILLWALDYPRWVREMEGKPMRMEVSEQ